MRGVPDAAADPGCGAWEAGGSGRAGVDGCLGVAGSWSRRCWRSSGRRARLLLLMVVQGGRDDHEDLELPEAEKQEIEAAGEYVAAPVGDRETRVKPLGVDLYGLGEALSALTGDVNSFLPTPSPSPRPDLPGLFQRLWTALIGLLQRLLGCG